MSDVQFYDLGSSTFKIKAFLLCSGFIKTEIGRNTRLLWSLMTAPFIFLFAVDSESGAQTSLHCALQPGIERLSGHYFDNCTPQLNIEAKARDDAAAKKLWELSESFCGLN